MRDDALLHPLPGRPPTSASAGFWTLRRRLRLPRRLRDFGILLGLTAGLLYMLAGWPGPPDGRHAAEPPIEVARGAKSPPERPLDLAPAAPPSPDPARLDVIAAAADSTRLGRFLRSSTGGGHWLAGWEPLPMVAGAASTDSDTGPSSDETSHGPRSARHLVLVVPWHDEADPGRRAEYLAALRRNLALLEAGPLGLDRVVLLVAASGREALVPGSDEFDLPASSDAVAAMDALAGADRARVAIRLVPSVGSVLQAASRAGVRQTDLTDLQGRVSLWHALRTADAACAALGDACSGPGRRCPRPECVRILANADISLDASIGLLRLDPWLGRFDGDANLGADAMAEDTRAADLLQRARRSRRSVEHVAPPGGGPASKRIAYFLSRHEAVSSPLAPDMCGEAYAGSHDVVAWMHGLDEQADYRVYRDRSAGAGKAPRPLPKEDLALIPLGSVGYENRLMYEFSASGLFIPMNPCFSIRSFHHHQSGRRAWRAPSTDRSIDSLLSGFRANTDGRSLYVRPTFHHLDPRLAAGRPADVWRDLFLAYDREQVRPYVDLKLIGWILRRSVRLVDDEATDQAGIAAEVAESDAVVGAQPETLCRVPLALRDLVAGFCDRLRRVSGNKRSRWDCDLLPCEVIDPRQALSQRFTCGAAPHQIVCERWTSLPGLFRRPAGALASPEGAGALPVHYEGRFAADASFFDKLAKLAQANKVQHIFSHMGESLSGHPAALRAVFLQTLSPEPEDRFGLATLATRAEQCTDRLALPALPADLLPPANMPPVFGWSIGHMSHLFRDRSWHYLRHLDLGSFASDRTASDLALEWRQRPGGVLFLAHNCRNASWRAQSVLALDRALRRGYSPDARGGAFDLARVVPASEAPGRVEQPGGPTTATATATATGSQATAFAETSSVSGSVDRPGRCLNNMAWPLPAQCHPDAVVLSPPLLAECREIAQTEREGGRAGKIALMRRYRFVVSIENVHECDYVTEKLWDALAAGAIPIYLGPPADPPGAPLDPAPWQWCHLGAALRFSPRPMGCLDDGPLAGTGGSETEDPVADWEFLNDRSTVGINAAAAQVARAIHRLEHSLDLAARFFAWRSVVDETAAGAKFRAFLARVAALQALDQIELLPSPAGDPAPAGPNPGGTSALPPPTEEDCHVCRRLLQLNRRPG
ncbi:hypothetical protein H696_01677 [Fonticula alba]|uniref:Fucosyltransferase n=1 Tax=Fonticula alba TaxID=691883 RepID=A0A058ZD19_FONAL|nr:hypothetical protein H696_01677 [Fonticula alba]KCV72279.1 hypothetical protein H696_01677 [Fonticula alba]|eukprot:XP_009493857.1 hypothetical protein H696_01677 [Fonticula alba]